MGTFYLGLSMAGTVSAGTYTGGSLIELDKWLRAWQNAKIDGVTIKAVNNVGSYKIGDTIVFTKEEIPQHDVKIKSMSGASGGGVSAALYLAGLTTGMVEELLKKVWMGLDVKDMLSTNDLVEGKGIYSALNSNAIDAMMNELRDIKWNGTDHAKLLDYLDDNIELFMTLGSLEGIPFKTTPSAGSGVSYGIHQTHLDYIKFNFQKSGDQPPIANPGTTLPYAYNLRYKENSNLKSEPNWAKLIESAPATGAFPIGFKPRTIKRMRKEYDGKLFYLNYSNLNSLTFKFDYSAMSPAWVAGSPDESFDMEYVDGGTFNREPHDLARASLMQSLGIKDKIESNGIDANACVILIDPFPTNSDSEVRPGQKIKKIPTLFELPSPLLGAMLNQGRFRPDWIERTLDEEYYSRFLISPIRWSKIPNIKEEKTLAGGIFGAFSGFISEKFREHDFKLGRYNSCQFLQKHFALPLDNKIVNYYHGATPALKEKYEAVGWFIPKKNAEEKGHCQIIPRMIEPDHETSMQPEWPKMGIDEWEEICSLAKIRARKLADVVTNFGWAVDKPADAVIWMLIKGGIAATLNDMEKELVRKELLRK